MVKVSILPRPWVVVSPTLLIYREANVFCDIPEPESLNHNIHVQYAQHNYYRYTFATQNDTTNKGF